MCVMKFQVSNSRSLSKVIFIIITMVFSQQVAALFSDNFTGGQNPAWRFYDPYDTTAANDSGESTLAFDGTNALITIPNGLQHDLYFPIDKNRAPRLLQAVSDTDFKFEVKFETKPNVGIQMQGLIIQETDNSFLRFEVYHTGNEAKLLARYVNASTNETATNELHTNLPNGSPNYRRVERSGNNWKFWYSYDGTDGSWILAADFDRTLAVTEVGFYAGTAGGNPAFLSSIDYFNDLNAPITDTDTWIPPVTEEVDPPLITTWYGDALTFGQPGVSQKWANILGHVSSDIDISSLRYALNNGTEKSLRFTPGRRIENAGDFNIEIDRSSLNVGFNTVVIKAKDNNDQVTSKIVTISYSENTWPLPYTADWSSLNTINEVESVAHIVDGLWELTADGIKTKETGYDRTIAIGDLTWPTDDYEVTVPFTLHSDFSGVGFAVGWQGHEGSSSPGKEWPLQALVWIRGSNANPTFNIVTYGGLIDWEVTEVTQQLNSLIINEKYMLKSYSESLNGGMSRFYAKFWKQSDNEPSAWNLQADVPTRDGSVLLVAHETDITFGNVSVNLASINNPPEDVTPPVISNIQVTKTDNSATITWETDELSNSVVDYGTDNNYGINVNDSVQTKTHSLTLTGLNSNVDYHFRVKSVDSSNNIASSLDQTFYISVSTHQLPNNEWHQISLPMNPGTNNTVADVFGDDGLGTYGTNWVVYLYDASNNAYVDLGENGILRQGVGYWIIQLTGSIKTLSMPTGSTPTLTALTTACPTGKCFEIPMVTAQISQWNMIGYPFNATGHFKNARIVTTGSPCDSDSGCTIDEAKTNNIFNNELWAYDGSKYVNINTTNDNLDPWQAFWGYTLPAADGQDPLLIIPQP